MFSNRLGAVFGTGISRVYPASNRSLARAIAASGAVLSHPHVQEWIDQAQDEPWVIEQYEDAAA